MKEFSSVICEICYEGSNDGQLWQMLTYVVKMSIVCKEMIVCQKPLYFDKYSILQPRLPILLVVFVLFLQWNPFSCCKSQTVKKKTICLECCDWKKMCLFLVVWWYGSKGWVLQRDFRFRLSNREVLDFWRQKSHLAVAILFSSQKTREMIRFGGNKDFRYKKER